MVPLRSLGNRVKVNKIINESFDLAFQLLESEYLPERPWDNRPYQAIVAAKNLFEHPTGLFSQDLNNFEHEVWRRWHQTNNREHSLDLQSSSNLLMHELWILLMAVQELNLGNFEVAEVFASNAELGLRAIKAKCLVRNQD